MSNDFHPSGSEEFPSESGDSSIESEACSDIASPWNKTEMTSGDYSEQRYINLINHIKFHIIINL
jgi:hypothetical protein